MLNSNRSSEPDWPRYVAVEGPIGAGKSSLATRLARTLGAELVLEEAGQNPFLERFYRDPRAAALPTQLTFLLQRARKAQSMRQADMFSPLRVSDFLLDKDRIFARLTLEDDEYSLYEQVYERMSLDAPAPDLVLYLQAPVATLLARIARRGIPYEQSIDASYLTRLSDAYAQFFHYYTGSALLMVNTAGVELASNDEDYAALLERMREIRRGRHFYNPTGTDDTP